MNDTEKTLKRGKLKRGSSTWLKQLMETVLAECPELVECGTCCRVIPNGYVCRYCGSNDPGDDIIDPAEFL